LDYFYNNKSFSTRISLKTYSQDYANLALSLSNIKRPRFQSLFSLGFHDKYLGSLSGTFSFADRYEDTDSKNIFLSYSRLLFGNTWFRITGSRIEEDDVEYVIFSGLDFALGDFGSGNLAYEYQNENTQLSASLSKNPSGGTGYGYRFNADSYKNKITDEWEGSGDASLQYNGQYGIYRTDYRRMGNADSYGLNMSGGIAFIDDSFYFSRPINDSFALVKVGEVKGVGVKNSNQKIGETDKNGEILVPNLISYYDNKLSIEATDMPLGYNLGEPVKCVSPSYRSGAVADFGVKKLQAVEGRLYFMKNEKKAPFEYAGLEIQTEDKSIESVVGTNGEFYLENMPSGKFKAKAFSQDKTCNFDMIIPKTDEIIINLGEILCQ